MSGSWDKLSLIFEVRLGNGFEVLVFLKPLDNWLLDVLSLSEIRICNVELFLSQCSTFNLGWYLITLVVAEL